MKRLPESLLGLSFIGLFLNPMSIPFALVAGFSFGYLAYTKYLESREVPDVRKEMQDALNIQKKQIQEVREEYSAVLEKMRDEMGKMALSLTKSPNMAPRREKPTNVLF
jgi:hypothetical protein